MFLDIQGQGEPQASRMILLSRNPNALHLGLGGVCAHCLSQHKAMVMSEASAAFPSLQLIMFWTQQYSLAVKPKPNKGRKKLCVGAQL